MLAADFFLPLRLLGSFFHVAMNGMAASDKLFKLLDTKEDEHGMEIPENLDGDIEIKDLSFSYDNEKPCLTIFRHPLKARAYKHSRRIGLRQKHACFPALRNN